MSPARTLRLPALELDPEKLGYFRFTALARRMLLTNDAGEWHLLDEAEFREHLAGRIGPDHPQHEALLEKGFLRAGLDLEALADKVGRRKALVGRGPRLHIVTTTLRTASCRAGASEDPGHDHGDMSDETARRLVDLAFQSSSSEIVFEFRGHDPTLNFEALQVIVESSRERNRDLGKRLGFSLITDFSSMTTEKADWLVDNGFSVTTNLDGPEGLHDWNRERIGGGTHAETVGWVEYLNRRFIEAGRDPRLWQVQTRTRVSRRTLELWREAVDHHVELGGSTIHLQALEEHRVGSDAWAEVGVTAEEYLQLYELVLDYLIGLNREGVEVAEGSAAQLLSRMLSVDAAVDDGLQSPCRAGLGELAYHWDGRVFPSGAARELALRGDDIFELGTVDDLRLQDVTAHPTVRSLALASLLDALPACATCWNNPYCGVSPVDSYMRSSDLFGQRPTSTRCKVHLGLSSALMTRLAEDETGEVEEIFNQWTILRPGEGALQATV